jgi:hypothetical protein
VRVFRRGSILAYAYNVYNSKLDPASGMPKLTTQMNLYRDGQLIAEGKPQSAEIEKQDDLTRIRDYSYLRLNAGVQPGDYAVQIIVRDTLGDKDAVSSQWIDFQVVE